MARQIMVTTVPVMHADRVLWVMIGTWSVRDAYVAEAMFEASKACRGRSDTPDAVGARCRAIACGSARTEESYRQASRTR